MTKKIDVSTKFIEDYLRLSRYEKFVVPEYQRGYSWTIQNCDKLWNDIDNFINSGGIDPYFFGTIILHCSDEDGKLRLILIDGQQRTTTFIILLKALLMRITKCLGDMRNDEDSAGLRNALTSHRDKLLTILYKAEPEDIPQLLKDSSKLDGTKIMEIRSINEQYGDDLQKILAARTFEEAEKEVRKIPRKQKENKYTNYFRNFKYFYDKLSDDGSQLNTFAKKLLRECQIIEIRSWQMNQAITMFNSLNSTGLPLKDADIISAQLYAKLKDEEQRLDFENNWKSLIETANDLEARKLVDIDGILQQYMYINRASEKEYMTKGYVDVRTPGVRRYFTEDRKDLLDKPLDFSKKLLDIAKKWEQLRSMPVVKLLLKFNENIKLFFASSFNRFGSAENISKEDITAICESLIRLFTLLELTDAGYSSTRFKTFLFGVNVKIVDGSVPLEAIRGDFDEHIRKYWNMDEVKSAILDYDENVLVYLNEYLFAKEKDMEFELDDQVTIEHIMPGSGRNRTTIQRDAGIAEPDEFEKLVNKIGNKILLEENINKSIGNDWFKTKKQTSVKEKIGYKDSKYALAQSLISYPREVWTREDIEKATEKAADRIVRFVFGCE